jgi:hypothetical protein
LARFFGALDVLDRLWIISIKRRCTSTVMDRTGERLTSQFLDGRALFGSLRTRTETWEWYVVGESVYADSLANLRDAASYSCSGRFTSGMQAVGRAVIIGAQA